jgi:hypothetical protein
MKYLIIVIYLISFSALGQIQIQVVDSQLDTQQLEKKKEFKVTREKDEFSSLPDKQKRDQLIKDLDEIKDWDELQKDIFYMDLKSKSIDKLIKKYPQLPAKKLKALKELRD